jgi:serine/threonine-protein kinase HipA
MTSRSCYVYLQLPGSHEVVTCGRYERETPTTGGAVGRFVYGRRYRTRTDAVPLDPVGLPLSDEVVETARLKGVPGALRDAAPDAWGRLVIDRQSRGSDLDEFDYLLLGPEDRAGALGFGLGKDAPPPLSKSNPVVQLRELREAARRIEAGENPGDFPAHLRVLVAPGTSLGGARPKAVVEDADGLWVAKFPSRGDRWNSAVVEGAMLALAKRSGIRTPPTRLERLGDEDVLLLRRFDREKVAGGYLRHRVLSGLTVLDAEEEITDRGRWSYLLLADELQRRSERPGEDKEELFRRMVFNALISNNDDHPRNHALVARGNAWRLAPAYDLTPQPSTSQQRDLALTAGVRGRAARRENLLSGAPRFGLTDARARAIIDDVKTAVAGTWEAEVCRLGGTRKDCEAIRPAFVYEGFEYTAHERPER